MAKTKRLNESQNPIINGGSADDFHKIIIPQNTTANLNLITPKDVGSIAYDTTLDSVVVINNSGAFVPIDNNSGGTVTSVSLTVPSFLSVSGSPVTGTGTLAVSFSGTALPIANGGTGQTTAPNAINALLPDQTSNSGKFLTTNGTVASWAASGGFSLLVFESTPVGAGAADAVLTVTGLLATDTIISVSQKVRGATTAALIGWDTQVNNSITGHWSADPGGLATVLVAVKR